MYIPGPSCNNFILILIVDIPIEPLEIRISYTWESCTQGAIYVHQLACSNKLSIKM
ncbi:Alpha-mannosidase G [Gossypium arboreum]|uniref:Alpha-mannosidase G n=1 Tax=Gossypium arboreum TaxID=29729 RepID=A0A0B0NDI1_GOSAR|nr:Alpha-mannosidase G [Gossypium arboreum]